MDQIECLEDHFNLRTKLREYVEELEEMYWERDRDFTIKKICFKGDFPQIYFPNVFDKKIIEIWLSKSAKSNINQAWFQLAHESVHLLSPCKRTEVLVVEEGMAVDYSRLKVPNYFPREREYKYSCKKFQEWKKLNPDIKSIHKEEPKISNWNVDILKKFTSNLSCDLATNLCTKFEDLPKEG